MITLPVAAAQPQRRRRSAHSRPRGSAQGTAAAPLCAHFLKRLRRSVITVYSGSPSSAAAPLLHPSHLPPPPLSMKPTALRHSGGAAQRPQQRWICIMRPGSCCSLYYGRGCGLQLPDCRLQTGGCHVQTGSCRLRTGSPIPTGNCQLRLKTSCRFQIGIFQKTFMLPDWLPDCLQTGSCQLQIGSCQLQIGSCQLQTRQLQTGSCQVQTGICQLRLASASSRLATASFRLTAASSRLAAASCRLAAASPRLATASSTAPAPNQL